LALKFVVRGTAIWAIEVAALGLLTVVLPGVSVTDRQVAVVAALVIALLNALVRPMVLLFAQNLGLILFGLISLMLNGLLVLFATRVLPGFAVDTLRTAFLPCCLRTSCYRACESLPQN
jgi:putative membrane protein